MLERMQTFTPYPEWVLVCSLCLLDFTWQSYVCKKASSSIFLASWLSTSPTIAKTIVLEFSKVHEMVEESGHIKPP